MEQQLQMEGQDTGMPQQQLYEQQQQQYLQQQQQFLNWCHQFKDIEPSGVQPQHMGYGPQHVTAPSGAQYLGVSPQRANPMGLLVGTANFPPFGLMNSGEMMRLMPGDMHGLATNPLPPSSHGLGPQAQMYVQQPQPQWQAQVQEPPAEATSASVSEVSQQVHSDIYSKYIKRLKVDKPTVTNFKRTLKASRRNTVPVGLVPGANATSADNNASNVLPYHWLSDSDGQLATRHGGSLTGALWALRKHMTKDAFRFKKIRLPARDGDSSKRNISSQSEGAGPSGVSRKSARKS